MDQLLPENALVMVLDGVQDPGNAGTILRAAEAFGANGVVLLKGTVNPYNPKCLRASAGSVFRLPLLAGLEESQVLTALQERGVALFAAMPRATVHASDAPLSKACAIVIGAEGRGVSPTLAQNCNSIRIPTAGVESLNAAIAAAVLLYEARRQRTENQ